MTAFTPDLSGHVRHYAGKIRTMRDEIRTRAFPEFASRRIRKDIGWPDRYPQATARRRG